MLMKFKAFFFIGFFVSTTLLMADVTNKYRINGYYIGQERIDNAPEIAVLQSTWIDYVNEYRTRERVCKFEIDIYRTGNDSPVERIILENGKAGGVHIFFDSVTIVGRVFPYQKLIAEYIDYFDDENDTLAQAITIYESDNTGPNTELLTLLLIKQ